VSGHPAIHQLHESLMDRFGVGETAKLFYSCVGSLELKQAHQIAFCLAIKKFTAAI